MFNSHVLKNVIGLRHVDYAPQIYSGELNKNKELVFRRRGYVYGPIRISADMDAPVGKNLVEPTTDRDFVRGKKAVFFVRDPRDVPVSSYYSFGFTHGLSRVREIRDGQERTRQEILKKTLDEYVLNEAERQNSLFKTLWDLFNTCERGLILKYEDMVDDFSSFTGRLVEYLPLQDEVIRGVFERSRPKEVEDPESHRRSGRIGNFRERLEDRTVADLNVKLADALSLFGYEP